MSRKVGRLAQMDGGACVWALIEDRQNLNAVHRKQLEDMINRICLVHGFMLHRVIYLKPQSLAAREGTAY